MLPAILATGTPFPSLIFDLIHATTKRADSNSRIRYTLFGKLYGDNNKIVFTYRDSFDRVFKSCT